MRRPATAAADRSRKSKMVPAHGISVAHAGIFRQKDGVGGARVQKRSCAFKALKSDQFNLNSNRFQFNLTIDLKRLPSMGRRYFVALASDL